MSNLQEASDLENNISISSRRFEESPFIERTDCPEMIRGVYAGRYFPIFIGENYLDKYWCLRQKALIFDVPEKPVEISGRIVMKKSRQHVYNTRKRDAVRFSVPLQ